MRPAIEHPTRRRRFRRPRLAAFVLIAGLAGVLPASAASHHKTAAPALPEVAVTAGDHKGLSRVLISWHQTVDYKIDETPGLTTITFDHLAKADLGASAKQPLRNIQSIAVVDDPQHLVLQLVVKPDAHARPFKTGNIVVVDILDSPGAGFGAPAPLTATETAPPKADAVSTDTVIKLGGPATASLAVFRRGPYLWLASDVKLTAPTVSGPNAAALGTPDHYTSGDGTLFRYKMTDDKWADNPTIQSRQHAGGWEVVLSAAPDTTASLPSTASAERNQLRLGAPGAETVLSFTDPEIGDNLKIVPLPTAGERVTKPHEMAEADLLPTVQGVVIAARGDSLAITAGQAQITIGHLGLLGDAGNSVDAPPLFDFSAWRMGGSGELIKNRRQIEHASLQEGGPSQRSQAIDLAHLFIANGFGSEGIGALNYAAGIDADLAHSPDFTALHGAAEALAGHQDDALKDFGIDGLKTQPEAILWRGFAEAAGNSDQRQDAFSILRSNSNLIENYPAELKHRFALALAALAIENNDQPASETALGLLTKDMGPAAAFQPAVLTLKAELAEKGNKFQAADKLYASIPGTHDQYWTAVGGFSAVENGLETKTMPVPDAIKTLEVLRYNWRGDDLEYKILSKLGELYVDSGDYKDGLEILRSIISLAPDTPFATTAKAKMVDAAKQAFSPEKASQLSPIDALELYNSLQSSLPPQTITDQNVSDLSERLAGIGLMDSAASLLDAQMKAAPDPAVKAMLGARMAAYRLIDDRPDLALQALSDSTPKGTDPSSDIIKVNRKLLQARALFKSGKPTDGLAAIQGLNTREADALRVDIAWSLQDWKGAAVALARLVGPVGADGKISEEQANIILNETVAVSLMQDTPGLDQLRQTYGAAMAASSKASAFALLTSPSSDIHAPSVDAVKASVSGIGIFENFLTSYRKEPNKA